MEPIHTAGRVKHWDLYDCVWNGPERQKQTLHDECCCEESVVTAPMRSVVTAPMTHHPKYSSLYTVNK